MSSLDSLTSKTYP